MTSTQRKLPSMKSRMVVVIAALQNTQASGEEKVKNMIEMRKNQALGCHVYEPTPKDVRRACEEIQAMWSPRERAQRAMIRLSELVEAINEERSGSPPDADEAGDEAELEQRRDHRGKAQTEEEVTTTSITAATNAGNLSKEEELSCR